MADTEEHRRLSEALRDVMADQAATAESARAAHSAPPRRSPPALVVVAVLAWGVLAWLWIARPAMIFGAGRTAKAMTESERDAFVRYSLYLEKARVEDFRRLNGRLPTSLAEAGPTEDGVTLATTSDGYVLEGTASGTTLRLTERMNADSFLGDATGRLPRPVTQ